MDNAIDDVVVLVENQYEITEGTSAEDWQLFLDLPTCATVSDLGSTSTVRKITITFGNPNTPTCLFRGNLLKGKLS
jgi:hypothetical protein